MKPLYMLATAGILTAIVPATTAVAHAPPPETHGTSETERNRAIIKDFVRLLFVQHDAKTAYENMRPRISSSIIPTSPTGAPPRSRC